MLDRLKTGEDEAEVAEAFRALELSQFYAKLEEALLSLALPLSSSSSSTYSPPSVMENLLIRVLDTFKHFPAHLDQLAATLPRLWPSGISPVPLFCSSSFS